MNINNCENILELIKTEVDRLANEKPRVRYIVLTEGDVWRVQSALNELIHTKEVIKDVLENGCVSNQDWELTAESAQRLEDLIK